MGSSFMAVQSGALLCCSWGQNQMGSSFGRWPCSQVRLARPARAGSEAEARCTPAVCEDTPLMPRGAPWGGYIPHGRAAQRGAQHSGAAVGL